MRFSITDLLRMKHDDVKIPMVTAYDYTSALVVQHAGIPMVLVGDSLGQVVLGYDSTVPVTMDDMIRHIGMVVRGTEQAHIVGDLPFMSYQISTEDAGRNAGRLLKDGGCQSVNLEGGQELADTIRKIVEAGVPVMGHIGLTPQSVNQLGGYKVQGREVDGAKRVLEDAIALQQAGAYAVVLELVPRELAEAVTNQLDIPTIGIGAGSGCDGQVQVFHDILGLYIDFIPKHTRRYAELFDVMANSLKRYVADVEMGAFPSSDESFSMKVDVLEEAISLTTGLSK